MIRSSVLERNVTLYGEVTSIEVPEDRFHTLYFAVFYKNTVKIRFSLDETRLYSPDYFFGSRSAVFPGESFLKVKAGNIVAGVNSV